MALLAASLVVLAGAEWPRVSDRVGSKARARRDRAKQKSNLRLLRTETDEFAASVERDLANLPTLDESNGKRRRG